MPSPLDEIHAKVGQVDRLVGLDRGRPGPHHAQFADATEDHQFIHVDPAAAAAGFGTIARIPQPVIA